ncbi:protein-L-isoaspartate(D-aspartate) O-methyltransferase [Streptomyces sp. WAC 06725]|uniref:ATP-grasp peptide maturase system methyltransferase n=1 Tax=Streptomyces sp. WAC 06725 TaxID=2203209 RepID=UPI000F73C64F|nr:ATP-grasp peptide maturase system methyltransferase [Streptomyces sp. WAC 06725]RSO15392.1 protein-L-isoaspartate(D-aspartate) O-methyltransferase [Streptomyces sp. WAC 06725]
MKEDELRADLVRRLTDAGHLRTDRWRAAAEAVPRHEFLRGGFFEREPGSAPTWWRPVLPGDDTWLERCYRDDSLVTQVAGTIVPTDVRGAVCRAPTSSSTMPGLVLRMLEELRVADGHRVLEIGTGTGYSTALLCHRVGADRVTSVEVDPDVATRARVALGACGHAPELVVGDGLAGYAPSAPYDRTIASCGILEVPGDWIGQTRPGGRILATVSGWLYASELACLKVGEGIARGRFLGGRISFMLARSHQPPPLGCLPDLTSADEQPTGLAAHEALDDWTARFVAQLAAPRAQHITLAGEDGRAEQVLLDVADGSWAALRQDRGRSLVRQGGPARLWDAVEEHVRRWRADGAPDLERFGITVGPGGQHITWPTTARAAPAAPR